MGRHRLGLPLAVVATATAAAAATLILRPRTGLIEPQAVEAQAYFLQAQLDKAHDFRDVQRWLALGGTALGGATLAVLALRPPRRVRRALERAGARPLLGGAAAGAAIAVTLALVDLPLDLISHERAVDVGLSTQSLGPWLVDFVKATGLGAVFAAAGAAGGLALVRRFPRAWFVPGAAAVVTLAALMTYVAPVLLAPIFNDFEPLPEGRLRSEVLELADRAEVDVGEVYRIDASRRTTGLNAYVGGLGPTKRVVLYDNLIDGTPPEEVRSVVAHELAHVRFDDVPRGLLWLAIVALPATLVVKLIAEAAGARHERRGEAGPAAVPALALGLGIVAFAVTCAGNPLSRDVEARADAFALELTSDPAAFIELERRLAVRNVSDPDPPELLHTLFGTHPTTVERIGIGLAWAAER